MLPVIVHKDYNCADCKVRTKFRIYFRIVKYNMKSYLVLQILNSNLLSIFLYTTAKRVRKTLLNGKLKHVKNFFAIKFYVSRNLSLICEIK